MTATATGNPLLAALEAHAGSRQLAVVERTGRRGEMPPLHRHDEDEAFHVLEGVLTLYAGGEPVRLEAGRTFVAPRGGPHTHVVETERARYRVATFAASVSRYEDYLRAVAPAPAVPNAEEIAALSAIAAASGITVLGPPGLTPARLAA